MTSSALEIFSYSAEQSKTTNTQATVEAAFRKNHRLALAAFESSNSIHKIEVHAFVSVQKSYELAKGRRCRIIVDSVVIPMIGDVY